MGRILLLVISTALAAPQGNFSDYSDITMDEVILERSAISERAINTCGCAPVSSTNRIVGGKEVNPKGKLPYQVMFYPCTPQGQCGLCGGTIVNKKFVITAAHCWDSRFTNLRVIVGEHSICDGINEGGKVINVKKGTMHPDYNKKTMDNDIAVLELSEELTFTDKIKPACLPSSATKDFSGTASTISGWGGTIGYGPSDPRPQQPQQCGLKETMVKVLAGSDSKCSGVLGTSRYCAHFYTFKLSHFQTCSAQRSSCAPGQRTLTPARGTAVALSLFQRMVTFLLFIIFQKQPFHILHYSSDQNDPQASTHWWVW